jgi:signal transduction histidine kinase/CheY-like chemotaxis protein
MSDSGPSGQDNAGRAATLRLIKLAMAAALIVPLLLFGYGSWVSYRSSAALTDERIQRSVDVLQEHLRKVLQSISLALDSVDELAAGMSDADIRRDEARLNTQLKNIVDTLSEVQSIWIFDRDGRPLVTTSAYPAPNKSYAEEDYFQAHRTGDVGTYIGEVHISEFNHRPFFTVSRRRGAKDDAFAGVVEVSIRPVDFYRFYATLAYGEGLQYALIRRDGTFLARYPVEVGPQARLGPSSGFQRMLAQDQQGGFYTTKSAVDGIERRFQVRRIGAQPLYVSAGVDTATTRWQWMSGMALHLIFGVPATLFLFATLALVLRRTKNLYEASDRRDAAEGALRQAQKMEAVGQLTGGIAHDFNNLLMVIIGNLEGAQRQLDSWREGAQVRLQRAVDNAMRGAQRAAELTQRLLAFSRQQPLNPQAIDANKLVSGMSDFLRRTLGEAISLEAVGAGGLWMVEADPAQLEAALLNLAVNARDAMPDGGKLTIETANCYLDEAYCRLNEDVKPGQYVQIAATDTGAGMSEGVLARAFEPFFTTKAPGQGTGLGLSQVFGFVKQSGGHVKIYSELGEGTTVKLYLPRLLHPTALEEPERVVIAGARDGEAILLVEDDQDVRAYVAETLRGLRYSIKEAPNGENALKLLDGDGTRFDLLLTDVVLPGMNGRVLADKVKAQRPGIKVLFMTGYTRNAIVHQGRLDPGVEMMQKPLSSATLAARIRQILDN